MQAGIFDMQPNVRRYVQVAAAWVGHAFLHSWCDAGLCGY